MGSPWVSALATVGVLCLGGAPDVQAQSILGRVVDAESGSPVVGAVVLLLDGEGERIDAKLTDDSGSFGFVGANSLTYRLRAEMIGRRGVEVGPFTLEGDARYALELPAEPIRLSGLAVTGEERCAVDPESARAVYTVWAEVEKALRAAEVTRSSTTHQYRIVEYDRWRERRSLEIVAESSSRRLVVGDERPFTSLPPDEIEAGGYVSVDGEEVWIYGPSAEVLLAPYFLRMHCFTLSRDASRPGWITLEFEPVDGRDVPELRGLLWIDETSAQLQALEFEYVNLPRELLRGSYTGSMQFRRLEDGGLIVNDWWLRSPHPLNRDRLREQAGSVVEVLPGR
ncbi:MAG: carboxypeptidase regulatory-like domain-containing protein [Gemmatimonadetes bacterium]|nr:carboxypeptidase regulatory-like domain-containing protein [Gemmatimonadota bacterium]